MSDVPILEVDREWQVDDLKTVADCDDAYDVLTEAIASIEMQLDEAKAGAVINGVYADHVWFRKAKAALRYKKAAIQRVQQVRARLAKRERETAQATKDRVLLDLIRETEPEAFRRAVDRYLASVGT